MKNFRFSGAREAFILLSLVATFILLVKAAVAAVESPAYTTINILMIFVVFCAMNLGPLPWPYRKYQKTVGYVIFLCITVVVLILEAWMKIQNQTLGLEYIIICRAILAPTSLLVIRQQTFSQKKPVSPYLVPTMALLLYVTTLLPSLIGLSVITSSDRLTDMTVYGFIVQGSIILIFTGDLVLQDKV